MKKNVEISKNVFKYGSPPASDILSTYSPHDQIKEAQQHTLQLLGVIWNNVRIPSSLVQDVHLIPNSALLLYLPLFIEG